METYPLFAGDIDLRFVERVRPSDTDHVHGTPPMILVLQWRRATPSPNAHYNVGPHGAATATLMWGEWQDVRLEAARR